jgi:hypothetical protein
MNNAAESSLYSGKSKEPVLHDFRITELVGSRNHIKLFSVVFPSLPVFLNEAKSTGSKSKDTPLAYGGNFHFSDNNHLHNRRDFLR